MTIRTEDWTEVAEKLQGLALKLKLHAESTANESSHAVQDAASSISDAVERSFETLRNAVDDPAVKADVKDVGQLLRDALSNTFAEVARRR